MLFVRQKPWGVSQDEGADTFVRSKTRTLDLTLYEPREVLQAGRLALVCETEAELASAAVGFDEAHGDAAA